MEFFILLLVNVFMGAVLYLVISLKLEKSASNFRERRLRKEMDEIIREFNETADRNISILESRIKTLKRMLEKTGDLKTLDVTLDDDIQEPKPLPVKKPEVAHGPDADDINASEGTTMGAVNNIPPLTLKSGLIMLAGKIFERISARFRPAGKSDREYRGPENVRTEDGRRFDSLIEKDLSSVKVEKADAPGTEKHASMILTDEEIGMICAEAKDKYSMISKLYQKGCSIEKISSCSGMPQGEVMLVLNLNRPL